MISLKYCQTEFHNTPLLHRSIKFKIIRNHWKRLNSGDRADGVVDGKPKVCWMSLRHPLRDYHGPTQLEENEMCETCEERKRRGEPRSCFWWTDPRTIRISVGFVEFGKEIYQAEALLHRCDILTNSRRTIELGCPESNRLTV